MEGSSSDLSFFFRLCTMLTLDRMHCLHCTFVQSMDILLFYLSYVSHQHVNNACHVQLTSAVACHLQVQWLPSKRPKLETT